MPVQHVPHDYVETAGDRKLQELWPTWGILRAAPPADSVVSDPGPPPLAPNTPGVSAAPAQAPGAPKKPRLKRANAWRSIAPGDDTDTVILDDSQYPDRSRSPEPVLGEPGTGEPGTGELQEPNDPRVVEGGDPEIIYRSMGQISKVRRSRKRAQQSQQAAEAPFPQARALLAMIHATQHLLDEIDDILR